MTFQFLANRGRIVEPGSFPDGEPRVRVDSLIRDVTCRIASPEDLFRVCLLCEVYAHNRIKPSLKILYLMGQRMDRRLSDIEPYSLRSVATILNSLPTESVSVFCPHSQATSDLLERYNDRAFSHVEDAFYDIGIINCIVSATGQGSEDWTLMKDSIRCQDDISIVIPDLGASKRFQKMELLKWYPNASVVTLHKDRDERTGKINGIIHVSGKIKKHCVIVDDLCDGGKTFEVAAETLRKTKGVKSVSLVVAHGIFSKGPSIKGIDRIFTTNSYKEQEANDGIGVYNF